MSKKDFSVALKYVEARPRSQRRKGAEARVSGISVVGSGASATDLSLLQANLISVTNNFTALKDLFDSMFEKDSDGNIHAKLSLWSSGGITAGGVGSGGSGGGGGISYNRLDSWADYSADKSGWVLSALLGKDLDSRVSALANAGYVTASALAPYALRSEIPSLVGYATEAWVASQGYITQSALSPYFLISSFTKDNIKSTLGISDWALASSLEWTAINGRPTKLSDFTDDVVNGNFLPINATAKDSEKFGGQVPAYYATASTLNTLSQTVANFKSLFDSMFEKDSDGNIHAKLSLWSSGGITAGGVGSGGSGGGVSYDRLDAWADYSADKAGYVLSAALGYDINTRLTSVENAGYVTASALAPYALRSEIPSLVGYATESFVTSQGYITASALGGYATQSWVESKNYLTGITSAMVTTALGYTPYNSANFTKDNLRYTLGISDWALASVKPTYTASEVGALSVNGGDIGGSLNFRNGSSITCANGIVLEMYAGVDTYLRGSSNIYISAPNVYTQRNVYTYKVLDSGNYSNYALSVNGGTVNGSITANSFIGNLVGVADRAGRLTATSYYGDINANNLYYDKSYVIRLDKNANIPSDMHYGNILYIGGADTGFMLAGSYTNDKLLFRRGINANGPRQTINTNAWKQIAFTDSNVASATKLATPRTIWGQSFDGTQDVTGALTAPSITTNSLTIGGVTITYDSVNEALCINGNMYALGGITAGGAGISAYTSLESRVARLEQQLNIS